MKFSKNFVIILLSNENGTAQAVEEKKGKIFMKKFDVEVSVAMNNIFTVYANSEDEAADKAKQAMDDILGYGFSYETETDEVSFMCGNDTITIGNVAVSE